MSRTEVAESQETHIKAYTTDYCTRRATRREEKKIKVARSAKQKYPLLAKHTPNHLTPRRMLYHDTLGEYIKEAGFPPGVINIVSGTGKTGSLLATHMKIYKISFTGSITSGRRVQDAANKSNLKPVTLELGGKSPAIVFNDADLPNALVMNSQGFLANTGQVCAACSRTLVQEKIALEFLKGLKEKFEGMSAVMGDPSDKKTVLGPVADKAQYERVMSFLDSGKDSGAELLIGGSRKGRKGCFIEPTIFLDQNANSKIYTDEIFGPVLTVRTFTTEEEAIELANNTTYGLAASIYTSDVTRAMRVSALLEAGTVTINAPYGLTLTPPFGGMKQSGHGRESGKYGLYEWLQPKAVVFNMGVPSKDEPGPVGKQWFE